MIKKIFIAIVIFLVLCGLGIYFVLFHTDLPQTYAEKAIDFVTETVSEQMEDHRNVSEIYAWDTDPVHVITPEAYAALEQNPVRMNTKNEFPVGPFSVKLQYKANADDPNAPDDEKSFDQQIYFGTHKKDIFYDSEGAITAVIKPKDESGSEIQTPNIRFFAGAYPIYMSGDDERNYLWSLLHVDMGSRKQLRMVRKIDGQISVRLPTQLQELCVQNVLGDNTTVEGTTLRMFDEMPTDLEDEFEFDNDTEQEEAAAAYSLFFSLSKPIKQLLLVRAFDKNGVLLEPQGTTLRSTFGSDHDQSWQDYEYKYQQQPYKLCAYVATDLIEKQYDFSVPRRYQ